MAEHDLRNDQRKHRRRHEEPGCDEQRTAKFRKSRKPLHQPLAAEIGKEENQQRPELQRQLQQRMMPVGRARGDIAFGGHAFVKPAVPENLFPSCPAGFRRHICGIIGEVRQWRARSPRPRTAPDRRHLRPRR
ncbi:hypothetical protein RHECNPAF_4460070 [Rhizobium etli CNPAF512]|nr:hypothetical protein RHECNPAF_4460070 [Rhizobium etli CNPAF512]